MKLTLCDVPLWIEGVRLCPIRRIAILHAVERGRGAYLGVEAPTGLANLSREMWNEIGEMG